MKIQILALETSCDETAAAIAKYEDGAVSILSSVVSSQIELHAKYGGVVPNLAAREHVRNIIPVVEEALAKGDVTRDDIDAIAVTRGPGLIPALLIGVSAAKTLAMVWRKPLLGIHHIEGHIYANFINSKIENRKSKIFPLLALVVSGGHTQLILMRDHFRYEIIGETRDDAAGEAFDKAARLLGLPYPGGPAIATHAANYELRMKNLDSRFQIPDSRFRLPRPMLDSPDFDFSFSGLKTAVLYLVKENEKRKGDETFIDEVAHEFQEAVVDVLVAKTKKAILQYHPKTVTLAGGVSANIRLREQVQKMIDDHNLAVKPLSEKNAFLMPEFKYSLDNAAMIGAAAAVRLTRLSPDEREQLKSNSLSLDPNANLPLG